MDMDRATSSSKRVKTTITTYINFSLTPNSFAAKARKGTLYEIYYKIFRHYLLWILSQVSFTLARAVTLPLLLTDPKPMYTSVAY